MRLLVCGGRDYQGDLAPLGQISFSILIHGGAPGADLRAAQWAQARGIHCARVDALWDFWRDQGQPKVAGFKRNAAMLLLLPEGCVAFPGGRGTSMMVSLCEQHSVPVWRPYG